MESYVAKADSGSMLSNALLVMWFGLALSACGAFFAPSVMAFTGLSFTVMSIIALVLKLALLFTSGMWSNKSGLNVILFSIFTLLWGFVLYPILLIALSSELGLQVAMSSFIWASALFFVMGVIGHTTKMDLSKFAGIAFGALIALIVVAVINMFLKIWVLGLIISGVSIILFSFFTAYDIQSIKNGHSQNAIEAWINLYIDFINLFVSLFHIIWSFVWGGED